MPQTIDEALERATFYTDNQPYELVKLPAAAITAAAGIVAEIGEPFCALVADKDEVSLLIPSDALRDFGGRLPGHKTAPIQYRLITIDVELDLGLVGFLARVSASLVRAGVPILPIAAYSRDHIFVPADQYETALAALERLKSGG